MTDLRCPLPMPGLLSREIDDELVLVDPRDGEAYLLNPMGSSILDLCDGRTPIPDIVREISHTLDTPEALVAPDVHKFVADLAARGLLVEGDPKAHDPLGEGDPKAHDAIGEGEEG